MVIVMLIIMVILIAAKGTGIGKVRVASANVVSNGCFPDRGVASRDAGGFCPWYKIRRTIMHRLQVKVYQN